MPVQSTLATAGGALSKFLHESMPNAWLRAVTFLVAHIGEANTYVWVQYIVARLVGGYNHAVFKHIYDNGLYEEYRIQNDRRIPKLLEDKAWEASYGLAGNIAALFIAFPQYYAAFYVQKWLGMPSLLEMPKSYKEAAKQFLIGTFAWDTLLFWIHYGLHKIPLLYRTIHKRHHEVKVVSAIIAAHAYITDLFLMDVVPTRFGIGVAKMNFPVAFVWNAWYTHIATRAHCGYKLPWDPLNWFVPYIENHDYHHRRTHVNFQTLTFVWDFLVGGHGDFWEWRARRWDKKQWKDGVGFIDGSDRDAAVWGETEKELEDAKKKAEK